MEDQVYQHLMLEGLVEPIVLVFVDTETPTFELGHYFVGVLLTDQEIDVPELLGLSIEGLRHATESEIRLVQRSEDVDRLSQDIGRVLDVSGIVLIHGGWLTRGPGAATSPPTPAGGLRTRPMRLSRHQL
jgi:hypothetical protein